MPARVWKQTFRGLLEDDSFAERHRIKTPTLIIWGDKDSIVPKSDQDALASAIAGAQLIVYPDAGHSVYWENPQRCASDIARFIDSYV